MDSLSFHLVQKSPVTSGLAKLEEPEAAPDTPTAGATSPEVLTTPGIAMGTVAYMSPEQAKGEELDSRTDIFSLGAVLYEMATGEKAFPGRTSAVVFKAILDQYPKPPTQVARSLPPQLEHIVEKALEKDRSLRYQNAADLRTDLQRLKRDTESARQPAVEGAGDKKRRGGQRTIGLLIMLGIVALAAAGYFYLHRRPRLTEKDTIVLADFNNKTGDPVFDDALNQALSIQLEQSPFLKILSDRKVSDMLKLMGRTPGEHITPDVAKEICIRSGSKAVLQGAISRMGNEYLLGLRATACVTGDSLTDTQGEARGKEGVLKTVSTMASDMRVKLGESMASVQKFDVPAEATTTSLEALKAYSMARTTMRAHGEVAAVPFLTRAIELDPQFAKAYLSLGKMYANLGDSNLAADNVSKAYSLRDRVSEVEKYEISAEYFSLVTGDLEKAIGTFDMWIRVYPRDAIAVANRGVMFTKLGQYGRALDGFRASHDLLPNTILSYRSIASANISLNRFQDAKSALDGLQQNGFDPELVWSILYDLAFLRNDTEEMKRQLAVGLGRPQTKSDALLTQARTEAYHGRLATARELASRASGLQMDASFREIAAQNQAGVALVDAECGELDAAREEATSALSRGPGRWAKTRVALAFVEIGEIAHAKILITELEKAYPFDTVVNRYWLPTVKAAIQIRQGSPEDAVSTLEPVVDYELASTGALYPAYMRGQAYLSARNAAAAVPEFQKLLDHPGVVLNDPFGALARLQLGRAYALLGDRTKAKTAYEDFLALWKDADSDVPILNEAKTEYAILH